MHPPQDSSFVSNQQIYSPHITCVACKTVRLVEFLTIWRKSCLKVKERSSLKNVDWSQRLKLEFSETENCYKKIKWKFNLTTRALLLNLKELFSYIVEIKFSFCDCFTRDRSTKISLHGLAHRTAKTLKLCFSYQSNFWFSVAGLVRNSKFLGSNFK